MPAEDQLFQRFGREFPQGSVLFRDGEPGHEMYVVQSGRVGISISSRGAEMVLATLGPGEFFGEMALLSAKPRSATATMLEAGRLLVVDPKNFEAMIRGNGEIAARLIKKLADRLQDADDQIENLLLREPLSRVMHQLIRLAQRSGEPGPEGTFVQQNLAELPARMGLTMEEVQDAVAKAVRSRIIALRAGGVILPDIAKALKYLEYIEARQQHPEGQ